MVSCSQSPRASLTVRQRAKDGVQGGVEALADIGAEEAEDVIAVFLQQGVLAAVAAVRSGVREMLVAVEFQNQSRFDAQEIHFHPAPIIERNRQLGIEPEPALGCSQ